MKLLTQFELQKIIRRKSFAIMLLLLILFPLLISFLALKEESSVYEDGKDAGGLAAIALEKEYALTHAGALTTDKLAAAIERYQKLHSNPDNLMEYDGQIYLNNEAYSQYEVKDQVLLDLLRNAFRPAAYDYNIVDRLKPEDAAAFYTKRLARVDSKLEETFGSKTGANAAYFRDMNARIATPYRLDYVGGKEPLMRNLMAAMMGTFLAVSICLARMFAGEYQTGADALILTSRHGRGRLIAAKLAASLLLASGLYLLTVTVHTLFYLIFYGVNGWQSPFQLLAFLSPYPLTILQAYLLCVLLGYLACLMMTAITLLLSARMKTAFPVIIAAMLILFAAMFIPDKGESQLLQGLASYLPGRMINGYEVLAGYRLFPFFGWRIAEPMGMGIFALLVTVIALPLASRCFKRHQVV
jgi:ABC-type transport system involved in multi-copper enzyme maturation permease subunit